MNCDYYISLYRKQPIKNTGRMTFILEYEEGWNHWNITYRLPYHYLIAKYGKKNCDFRRGVEITFDDLNKIEENINRVLAIMGSRESISWGPSYDEEAATCFRILQLPYRRKTPKDVRFVHDFDLKLMTQFIQRLRRCIKKYDSEEYLIMMFEN